MGRPRGIFLPGGQRRAFQRRQRRVVGGGQAAPQQVPQLIGGRVQQGGAPLLGPVEQGRIGLMGGGAGGKRRLEGACVDFPHEAADILQLPPPSFFVPDSVIEAQGFRQIRGQGQGGARARVQLRQLLAQLLQGRALAFSGRAARRVRGVRFAVGMPLEGFFTRHGSGLPE